MIKISDSIRNGSIYIKPNFLGQDLYEEFNNKVLKKYKFKPMYQPHAVHYGNRFQAQPCWETETLEKIDKKIYNVFKKEIENILDEKLTRFDGFIRKNITEEIKISKVNTKYGVIHMDQKAEFACVYQFTQSIDGGTAFFENAGDKYPDIEISAYTDRLIMYSGRRWHTNCIDFTFPERNVLALFIKTEKFKDNY